MGEVADKKDLLDLLQAYREELLGLTKEEHEKLLEAEGPTQVEQRQLVLNMVDELTSTIPETGVTEKVNRWLGFIQGTMWALGLRSINRMHDENRPIFKKIEFSPQEKVEEEGLQPYISRVLEAVGHPEAWISDMSIISDFAPYDIIRNAGVDRKGRVCDKAVESENTEQFLRDVSVSLGFEVRLDDYIYRLAEMLRDEDPELP